jgi:hypothetical protein
LRIETNHDPIAVTGTIGITGANDARTGHR